MIISCEISLSIVSNWWLTLICVPESASLLVIDNIVRCAEELLNRDNNEIRISTLASPLNGHDVSKDVI